MNIEEMRVVTGEDDDEGYPVALTPREMAKRYRGEFGKEAEFVAQNYRDYWAMVIDCLKTDHVVPGHFPDTKS